MKLSDHFTYEEATFSSTAKDRGFSNVPPDYILNTIVAAAQELEKVRMTLGVPMKINSWYRSPAVNAAVGSANTSQHLKGEAVDFVCTALTPLQICRKLIANVAFIHYDQLILEHDWVHISFAILTGKPRHQVLSLLASKKYAVGLTDLQGNSLEAK